MAKRKLTVVIAGDAKGLNQTLDGAGGALGRFGRTAGAGIAAVGVATAAFAASSISAASGFQDQMREVFTLIPNGGQEMFDSLSSGVKDFSSEFGVLPEEVIPALYDSLSAGVPPGNVFDFMETAQKAARGGATDLGVAVDGLTSVVNAYGTDVISAGEASDLMFTAVRLGKTTMEELSSSMSNVTPIAASLGIGFEDITAGLAVMTSKGVPTAQATTQLRAAFTELSKEGSKVSQMFAEVSGQSFADFIEGGGSVADAFGMISSHAEASGISLADVFGSIEGASAVMTLGADDAGQYQAALAEMAGSAGATDQAFATMNEGLGAATDRLKAKFAVLMIEIGEKLIPAIEAAVDWFENKLVPAIHTVIAVFQEEGLGGVISLFAEKFSEIWPTVQAKLAEFGANLLSWLGEQIPIIAEQLAGWGKAFVEWLAPNIPPLVEQLAQLLARVTEWIVVEALPVIGEKLLEWGVAFVEWALPIWVELQVEMLKLLANLGEWLITTALPEIALKLLEWAKAFGEWVLQASLDMLAALPGLLADLGSWLTGTALPEIVTKLVEWALAFADFVIDAKTKMVAKLPEILSAIGSWALGAGTAAVTAAGTVIANAMKAGFSKVKDLIVSVITELPGKIAGAVFGMIGQIYEYGKSLGTAFKNGAIAAVKGLAGELLNMIPGAGAIKSKVGNAFSQIGSIFSHTGGIYHSPNPGGEGFAILRDGERVVTPGHAAQGGSGSGETRVVVQLDTAVLVDALARFDRRSGTAIVRAS